MLACGPGLLINSLLKPHCHRPRPNQIAEFGGSQSFVPVLMIGKPAADMDFKSFPSGHASMGFFLMTPAFVLRRSKRRWARAFLWLGLAAGVLLGVTRIAQGRHFPSDVLWSGGLVYFTAVLLHYAVGLHKPVAWRAPSWHAFAGHSTVPMGRPEIERRLEWFATGGVSRQQRLEKAA
jgi:membrane-associated PAP2 superfamily phosphatase